MAIFETNGKDRKPNEVSAWTVAIPLIRFYLNPLKRKRQDEAINQWLALTEHDRKLRDAFYLEHLKMDEDECWDHNTADDDVDIKALWEQISDMPEVWADSLEKWLGELR